MLLTAAAALCSCRDHATAISREQGVQPASTSVIDAAASDLDAAIVDASDALDASAGAPFDAGPLKAAVKIADARKWLTDHGAAVAPYDEVEDRSSCEEIAVGTAREAALVCTDLKDESRHGATAADEVYRLIEHRIARVVRAGKAVSVLDAEITLEPLDREMGQKGNFLDLRFRLAPDGMSATIDDHGPGVPCPQNLNAKSSGNADAWSRFDRELTTRMCNARGGYVWQGDHFVRDPNWKDPTPAGAHVTSAPTSTMRMGGGWDPSTGEGSH